MSINRLQLLGYMLYNPIMMGLIKSSKFIFILSIAFCALAFLWLCRALLLGFYPDFNTQYFVPKLLFSGVNPYIGGSNFLYTPQAYPPTVSFFYLPFSLMPLIFASYCFTIISIFSLLLSLFFLSKIFRVGFFSVTNLLLMGLVFIMFPVRFTLGMGQINLIVLSLIVYGLWLIVNKKEFFGGVFLGISLMLKLFPVFLPVYFILNLKNKIIGGILLSVIVLVVLVLFFIPFNVTVYFFKETIPSILGGWKLDYYNQSLSGFVGRTWGTGELGSSIKTIVSLLLVVLTFFVVLKNKKTDSFTRCLVVGVLITLNLIVNTFSWQHHFVWMIIPFYATFFYLRKLKYSKKYFVTLFVSYFLISINFKDPGILPVILQSHVFFGGIMLFFLDIYCLIAIKKNQY